MAGKALAAVITGPRTIEVREVDIPDVGEDDALVRIEASGVCGTDYEGYHGDYFLPYPVIQGHEPLGVIEVIGPEAKRRWGVDVGDRVAVRSRYRCGRCQACWDGKDDPCPNGGGFGSTSLEKPPGLWGGHAEFMYLAPGAVVHPIDSSLPAEVAVMFNPLGAGFAWAVEATGLEAGQSIAILGGGQRGICSVIAAKEAGASFVAVTGLGRDEHKLALAREFGADMTINVEAEDAVGRIMEATGGEGVDTALDLTPYAVDPVTHGVGMLKSGGTMGVAGLKGGRLMKDLSSDDLVNKEVTLKGIRGVPFDSFLRAVETIESRRYPLEKLHTHTFPVEETEEAIKTLAGETSRPAIHVAVIPRAR